MMCVRLPIVYSLGHATVEHVALDGTDFRIVEALVRNGRASFANLGATVGLSPHAAADRVRRLTRAGVITGFTAIVDLERVGRAIDAFIDVRLQPTVPPEEFEAAVGSISRVRDLAFVTGRFDYHVRVACADVDELDETVRAVRHAGAAQTETRIVLRSTAFRRSV
jgi:Lrp/AsnC family transcriptional regulator, leucine-responsive regulatory protein